MCGQELQKNDKMADESEPELIYIKTKMGNKLKIKKIGPPISEKSSAQKL